MSKGKRPLRIVGNTHLYGLPVKRAHLGRGQNYFVDPAEGLTGPRTPQAVAGSIRRDVGSEDGAAWATLLTSPGRKAGVFFGHPDSSLHSIVKRAYRMKALADNRQMKLTGGSIVATFGAVIGALIGFVVFGWGFLLGAGLGQCSPTICCMYGLCGGFGGGAFCALLLGGLGAALELAFGTRSSFFRTVAPGLSGMVIGFVLALVFVEITYPANLETLKSLESPLRTLLEQMGYQKESGRDDGMLGDMLVLYLSSFGCGIFGWHLGRQRKSHSAQCRPAEKVPASTEKQP